MSNQTKHTPGPWVATQNNSVYGANQPRPNGQEYRVLIRPALQTEAQASQYGGTLDEQKANAALIAAAPDLLEALEAVDKILYHYLDEVHPLRVKIETALAKAKGE